MARFEKKLKELIIKLHEIEALKFGLFKMKVGIDSPVYVDMRSLLSYPVILVSEFMNPMWGLEFQSLMRLELLFWGRAYFEQTNRIFKIQKRAIRIIVGINTKSSCRKVFKELNILTLPSLYIQEIACFVRQHCQ